ncbi:MAG: hypothetical protein Q9178_004670 [Gyalolechia marmorata]
MAASTVSEPISCPFPRGSARFNQIKAVLSLGEVTRHHQLPSPSSSEFNKKDRGQKRQRTDSAEIPDENKPSKRTRVDGIGEQPEHHPHDPVTHWVYTDFWPQDFGTDAVIMNQDSASERSSVSQDTSRKRKSSSSHRSDRLERMAVNGVFMKSSTLAQKSSKQLCTSLLRGERTPVCWPSFPPDKISDILERLDGLNEGRIQRDVTPWVVPSAENLYYCGQPIDDWIGDEVQVAWTRCATLGSTRPKPDYAAGLQRKAFTQDEIQKLRNYASPLRPFFFTPDLCFPFLICEAKSGDEGLNEANRQNIHSASIAVRAIIELYKAAYGKTSPDRISELYGQVLVFTISHNQNVAWLYGHYAVAAKETPGKEFEFYRYPIALFSFSLDDGRDRYRTYNFVQNVYEKFAPEHRKRIKDATASLEASGERTGLSFVTSSMELDENDSQANSQDSPSHDDGLFKVPSEPASTARMRAQMDQQRQANSKLQEEMKKQQEKFELKLEQERAYMKQQMEEQKENMKQQMEQQKEIISLLKQQASARG